MPNTQRRHTNVEFLLRDIPVGFGILQILDLVRNRWDCSRMTVADRQATTKLDAECCHCQQK